MAGTLAIRRQIRSTRNTKKITKAMELVAAAKMRKAVANALATRSYAHTAWDLLGHLARRADRQTTPLLSIRPVKKSAVIVIGSNRGLCGSFNNQIVQKSLLTQKRDSQQGAADVAFITFGRRVRDGIARQGHTIAADFAKNDITTSLLDISPIAHMIIDQYKKCAFDRVSLVYSTFVSSVKQTVGIKQLLPLEYAQQNGEGITDKKMPPGTESAEDYSLYLFEPSERKVLRHIIPRLLETQVFQAVLESEASEHSARMMAMHNATQAASDILQGLQLTFNQVRQTAITQEVAELSAGRAALEV
ncbi:ATP synthase F1 subunit gamma [Candidatus Uhrbacteria bacterium]|nr:ATP synthase F1 subunit gamma [Candidatus Uhrbacteria bacterium]